MKSEGIILMFVCPGIIGRLLGRALLLRLWTTTPDKAAASALYWQDMKDGKATLTPLGLLRTLFIPRGREMFLLEDGGVFCGFVVERK